MYLTMHFGPETARVLRANVTSLASSARHQCVAFNYRQMFIVVCVMIALQGTVKSRWIPPTSSLSYTHEKTGRVWGVPQLSLDNGKSEEGRCPSSDSVQNRLRKKLAHLAGDDGSNEMPETRRGKEEWETTPNQSKDAWKRSGRRRRHFSAKKQRRKAKKRQRKTARKDRHSKQVLLPFKHLALSW